MVPRVAGNFCAEANGKRSRVTSQVPPASALPPCGHITWYEGGRRKARKTTGMGLEGEKRERRKEKLKAARRQYEKPERERQRRSGTPITPIADSHVLGYFHYFFVFRQHLASAAEIRAVLCQA